MNRKIAFRAWDKENKVMYEVKKVDFSEQKVFCKQYYLNDWKFSEIELMQYTGLKDKNGKDIYEGDVVKHYNGIKEVQWNAEAGAWDMRLSNYTLDQEAGNYESENIEVIGDIYQNPELLDK